MSTGFQQSLLVFRTVAALSIVATVYVQSAHRPSALLLAIGSALVLIGSAIGLVRNTRRGTGNVDQMLESNAVGLFMALCAVFVVSR